ncbi:MAG: hypothetical protein ACLF0G_16760 [Candidatus Brocadiia bacterium]
MKSKVLLIESDATLAKRLTALLRQSRFHCDHCLSLAEALERLGQGAYEAAVLDLDLAGLEPEAASRKLRDGHPSLLLIGLDSMAEHRLGDGDLTAFDALIPKPFVADALLEALAPSPRTT